MKPIDQAYFEKCKRLIANNLGLGKISSWKQRDYEKLCDLIFERTNVSLSLTTIKRILNKDVNQLPQKATLDALAKFIGYSGWFDFIQHCPEITARINNIEGNGHKNILVLLKKNKVFYLFLVVTLALLTIGLLFYVKHLSTDRKIVSLSDLTQSIMNIDTLSDKKYEGLALTPPMGWNTWNTFGIHINEKLIKEIANLLVESGLRDAGYQYLIIDDGWQAPLRDQQGNLRADAKKFPGGIKTLADYIHSKGLKIGLYSCAGSQSCKGSPGGRGHEFQDARIFASWGVDYLKYDWCSHGTADAPETYKIMRDALYSARRPMVFSICEWGSNQPWKWAKDVGHMWRTTGNITDCFDCNETFSIGWKNILDKQVGLEQYAGPDQWNDPDMLEVGNPGLSLKESKAHFSMWCMLAAPLIAGNDLRKMPDEVLKILIKKDAIAINQDRLGKQGYRYSSQGGKEIWIKQLSKENWAVCFLNTSKSPMTLNINWHDFIMFTKEYTIHDIWEDKDIGTTKISLDTEIKSNDVLLLKLTPGL